MNLLSSKPFYSYLAILIWAPLPLGSNRPWAWLLLSLLCFLLAVQILIERFHAIDGILSRLKNFRTPLVCLFLVASWVSLQSLTLPFDIGQLLSQSPHPVQLLEGRTSYSISLDPARTAQLALLSWAFFLFFSCTLLLLDSEKRIRTTLIVLVTMGILQATYAVLMTLTGVEYGFFTPKQSYIGMATGTFVNRNHLAGFLEMSLALGIGLQLTNLYRGKARTFQKILSDTLDSLLSPKFILRVGLAVMVIALILTRSRMGNAAFFMSLPICALTMMALQRRINKGALVFFISIMAVDFFIIGEWFGFDELAERVQSSNFAAENRDELAIVTLESVGNNLVTGTGAGTYFVNFPAYQRQDMTPGYTHAHNDYLEFISTFGLLGSIPLIVFVLSSLQKNLWVLAKRRYTLARGVAFGSLMATVSLLLHSIADFNLQIPANALIFIVVLALGHLAAAQPYEQKEKKKRRRRRTSSRQTRSLVPDSAQPG